MRRYAACVSLMVAVALMAAVGCKGKPKPSLKVDKPSYKPGDTILVTFVASEEYGENAWVGLIPSDVQHGSEPVNDQNDISYQYLKKRDKGSLTFTAPDQPGQWDFRMNTSDSDAGKEVAYTSFRVEGEAPVSEKPLPPMEATDGIKPTMTISKAVYAPDEKITVQFTASSGYDASAWIGIIPSSAQHGSEEENDKVDIEYQYLKKITGGSLTFNAPHSPGEYDFRMHDTDNGGNEVASISFTVEAGANPDSPTSTGDGSSSGPTVTLSGNEFAPGADIEVDFTAPESYSTTAWIGIIPSSAPHGSEEENDKVDLAYQYLNKKTSGRLTFKAPDQPGSYDIRMHDGDEGGSEVASVSFTVK